MMAVLSTAIGSALDDWNIAHAVLKAAQQDGAVKDTRPWLQTHASPLMQAPIVTSAFSEQLDQVVPSVELLREVAGCWTTQAHSFAGEGTGK